MGMDSVELVMRFEEDFGITIPDSAAEKMVTPGDVIAFVVAELHRLGRAIPEEDVAARVRHIVLDQTGIKESAYSPEKRFIQDFGID